MDYRPSDLPAPPPSLPLFLAYPGLDAALPRLVLGAFPTPVYSLRRLGGAIGLPDLFVKDDGRSSDLYGGNKIRKLEFLLAAARRCGAREVLTVGYAGSNHATATAVHAERVGMHGISMLLPQRGAAYLRKNLLLSLAVGAELHEYRSTPRLVAGALLQMVLHTLHRRRLPFFVPPGGSSALGTVGFVNAAFELAAQVQAGLAPVPDRVYVAFGSMGSAVGLALGFAALGWPTRVVAVRVVDDVYASRRGAVVLWRKVDALLRRSDAGFPATAFCDDRVEIRDEFRGEGYACFSPEGDRAVALAAQTEGLVLDGTYTGKTLACLIADAEAGRLEGRRVLFWNTCNSADVSARVAAIDPARLPQRLRRYFGAPDTD
ncbi:MAG: pyridoxal-phosphate dependent enzyme [Deltaproteobacteria bacterium]|nr:pyridoxal-phosphate dependent enzyme [Deltaproteobacteria bacterium]